METTILGYMGGCQNYGPFLGTLNIRCRSIIGTQKGTITLNPKPKILTSTHIGFRVRLGLPSTHLVHLFRVLGF